MCTNVCVNERKSVRPLPIPGGLVLHFENGFTRLWLLPVLGLFSWNRTNRWYFTLPVQPSYPTLHSSLLLSSCLLVLYWVFFLLLPRSCTLVCSLAQLWRCNNRLFIKEGRDTCLRRGHAKKVWWTRVISSPYSDKFKRMWRPALLQIYWMGIYNKSVQLYQRKETLRWVVRAGV